MRLKNYQGIKQTWIVYHVYFFYEQFAYSIVTLFYFVLNTIMKGDNLKCHRRFPTTDMFFIIAHTAQQLYPIRFVITLVEEKGSARSDGSSID